VVVDLEAVAGRLFADVMAPLVLGGAIQPGHAIGARVALGLGDRVPPDADLAARVAEARVRRARRLAPVDTLPDPTAAEWALAAAFHDLLQAANPVFDAPLRRRAAARILELAIATIERVPPPETLGEALSRHAWFARVPEVARTDTAVKWWSGTREFLGIEPPERLQAWPRLRRVKVVRTPRTLLDLKPLAVDRDRLGEGLAQLLARTPLSDLATCTRAEPAFGWQASTLGVVSSGAGRTLTLRALARLPPAAVDASIGRATRDLLARAGRGVAGSVLALLAERSLLDAEERRLEDPSFAQALGAVAARESFATHAGVWSEHDRNRLASALAHAADSPAGREARQLLESPTLPAK
jgi:hypothetical protein